jgi:hypothetical protein
MLIRLNPPIALGAWTPNSAAPWDQSSAAAYSALFGKPPDIIHWYQDLVHSPAFDPARCDEVVNAGAMPLISWELDDYTAGAGQAAYTNAAVTGGALDTALISWLTAAGTWGKLFMLRPFWEMTGRWYPWAAGLAPNTPGSFIDGWRHIARLARLHAPLAQLIWCPSVDLPGLLPLEDCYPGHAYVDVLGLDGYRKTGADGNFQQIFQANHDRLIALAPHKPIVIAEVGCAPGPPGSRLYRRHSQPCRPFAGSYGLTTPGKQQTTG